jgi:hypothetical protein
MKERLLIIDLHECQPSRRRGWAGRTGWACQQITVTRYCEPAPPYFDESAYHAPYLMGQESVRRNMEHDVVALPFRGEATQVPDSARVWRFRRPGESSEVTFTEEESGGRGHCVDV